MTAIFTLLDGISPWWWVALALALGALELTTFSYYLLWLALAALSVGGALWVSPGLSGMGQLGLFAVLAVVWTVVGYLVVQRRAPEEVETGLNNRAAALIGRKAVVSAAFEADIGSVEIDGIRWRGRYDGADRPEPGDVLEITGAEGMTLDLSRPQ